MFGQAISNQACKSISLALFSMLKYFVAKIKKHLSNQAYESICLA